MTTIDACFADNDDRPEGQEVYDWTGDLTATRQGDLLTVRLMALNWATFFRTVADHADSEPALSSRTDPRRTSLLPRQRARLVGVTGSTVWNDEGHCQTVEGCVTYVIDED